MLQLSGCASEDTDDRVDEILPVEVRRPALLASSPVAILHTEEAGARIGVVADNLRKSPCETAVVQIGCNNAEAGAPVGNGILRGAPPLLSVLAAFGHS